MRDSRAFYYTYEILNKIGFVTSRFPRHSLLYQERSVTIIHYFKREELKNKTVSFLPLLRKLYSQQNILLTCRRGKKINKNGYGSFQGMKTVDNP